MKLDIPDQVLEDARQWALARPPEIQAMMREYPLFTKVHVEGLGVRIVTAYAEGLSTIGGPNACGHYALGLGRRPEERSEYVCLQCAEGGVRIIEHAEPYTPELMDQWFGPKE